MCLKIHVGIILLRTCSVFLVIAMLLLIVGLSVAADQTLSDAQQVRI